MKANGAYCLTGTDVGNFLTLFPSPENFRNFMTELGVNLEKLSRRELSRGKFHNTMLLVAEENGVSSSNNLFELLNRSLELI
ncbi:MAG: hypothetical protein UT48_C0010G0044 [Parcubacteria group bacterium GW2011_GWE2_39_37]|uniref:Uncharacterized protein n=1 Tax=Candidatus Falkowbacteria bacterium GW2011_GWF2_39_8 TaxID=1618642 RepID=A0A0G0SF59_9BACT|nr:MAG: hypothetical protein UT48_C0010G0044 [Parcubacteria group bacterium GW2011_GWE2_39_37]KKR33355.1 MAG: hypothetical protein UT64_C0010G0029 [Candidatus Falkowbacteria bacterium GW2011_GWF2_39_8]